MASTLAVGLGVATAAFLVSSFPHFYVIPKLTVSPLRAALVWSPTAVLRVASTLLAKLSSKGSFDGS